MEIKIGHKPSCLLRLYKAISEERKLTFHLDFSDCTFVEPCVLLPLTQLCIEGLKRELKISYTHPNDSETNKYLNEIGWHDFVENGYRLADELNFPERATTLPFWCVSKDYIHNYLEFADTYFHSIDNTKDWTGFKNVLDELLNNVYDHASDPDKEPAYVFAQYSSRRKKLTLVISDLGIGLSRKIKLFHKKHKQLSTQAAIRRAFESGYSTKSIPQNRGLGLDNVSSFVQSTESQLSCYTEDICLLLKKDGFFSQKIKYDPIGTLFSIELNPNLLKESDEVPYLDW